MFRDRCGWVAGRDDVWVVGDIAYVEQDDGTQVPGVAQGAIQMGTYVGRAIRRICQGREVPAAAFRYRDKGSLATIGRGQAVMDVGRIHLSGFLGWIVWAIVHIWFLVNFRSRLMAMAAWVWAYIVQDGVNELIESTLQKGAVDRHHRPQTFASHARCEGYRVLLRNSHIDILGWDGLLKQVETRSRSHRSGDADHPAVLLA